MKVAISSVGENTQSAVSEIFGRCPYFIMVEIKDNKIEKTEALKNESVEQNSGAGVTAAQLMVANNINIVITGNVGPRALEILRQFNIEIYNGTGIVKDVLQDFIESKLKKID